MTGRARLFSVSALRARFAGVAAGDLSEMALPAEAGLVARHLPRVLLRAAAAERRVSGVVARPTGPPPGVTVIIPTRDRVDLLRKCIESLRRETAPFEAVIVDNGSIEDATKAYFAGLAADARFSVLHRPGPFNFARLCNEAAGLSRMPALLLLNNDVEAIEPGWLGELTAWTNDPTVGAVAPKLLYPNRTVQHAGVVLGVEGVAGHFEYGLAADDPGYFGRLNAPYSSSAVTGACLAVRRDKFLAVGGLDEVNLPVELNDIDFCLRLAERGWRSIVDGRLRLIHIESASRGRTCVVEEQYPREWSYFRRRWMHRLRNDPAFSPSLSLESNRAALP